MKQKKKTKSQASKTPPAAKSSTKASKARLQFLLEAPTGSTVYVAGSFNGWGPAKHRLTEDGKTGVFKRQVNVEPGTVEYKFVVDGEWQIDSACPKWIPNEFGTLNSVSEVT